MMSQTRIAFHIINSSIIMLKGIPAFQITSTYLDPDQYLTIKNMAVFTFKNNKTYTFEYFAESSNYARYLHIIQDMINSFKTS